MSIAEIEALFDAPLLVIPDTAHSLTEARIRAISKTAAGRMILLVFTIRRESGRQLIRPISARYMHAKEIAHYEKENPEL